VISVQWLLRLSRCAPNRIAPILGIHRPLTTGHCPPHLISSPNASSPRSSPRTRSAPSTNRRPNDHGGGGRLNRHGASSRLSRSSRASRPQRNPQLHHCRFHRIHGCHGGGRTGRHAPRRRIVRPLRRTLSQSIFGISLPRRLLGRHRLLHRSRAGSLRHLHGLLAPRRAQRCLGHRILGTAASGQPGQRRFLWTLRVLVFHDQVGDDRGLHPGRSGPALHRTRSPAIHRQRRILSQRSNRSSAGGVLVHLRLWRHRNARRHHR
jgi:hypothetical protein